MFSENKINSLSSVCYGHNISTPSVCLLPFSSYSRRINLTAAEAHTPLISFSRKFDDDHLDM